MKIQLGKDYLKNLSRYLKHDDFIDGCVDAVAKYLVKHTSERSSAQVKAPDGTTGSVGNLAFQVRRERLANENLCEPILLQWEAYLTQEYSKSDALDSSEFEAIVADMDGLGTSLDEFIRRTHRQYLGYGRKGVLVEGPADIGESLLEARERNERSFAMSYEPWLIMRLERFMKMGPKRGKICDLILLESVDIDETSGAESMVVRRFWIEAQGENYQSQRFKIDGSIFKSISGLTGSLVGNKRWSEPLEAEPIEEVVYGGFDEIPFVVFGEGPREDSIIYSTVDRNVEHMNKKSIKDMIDYYQGFQRVVFFGVRPEEAETWAENIALFLNDPDAKMQVVPTGDPASITAELEKIERNASLDGSLRNALRHQLMTKQVQSADSKREDNATFENYLGYVTDTIEAGINAVFRYIWMLEKGSYPAEGEAAITLGRDFRISYTETELERAFQLHAMLNEFGSEGRKARAALAITALYEQRLRPMDDLTEDDFKDMLVQGVWKAGQQPDPYERSQGIVANPDIAGSLDPDANAEET